jgi:4-oxalocrotonate tautomerase
MPEVYVHIVEGRTVEQKRALAKNLTDVVVRDLGVPAEAVLVEFVEAKKHDKAKGGFLFADRPPPR